MHRCIPDPPLLQGRDPGFITASGSLARQCAHWAESGACFQGYPNYHINRSDRGDTQW